MSAQAKAAPPMLGATRRGNLTPTGATRASATAMTSPPPAAATPSPAPSHAAAAFAATQQLFQDESKQQQQQQQHQAPVRMQARLETLANRFDGFEDELNLSRSKRKADEDKRIHILQTQLTNLQSSLALESKNRSASVKALQSWLTDRIAAWTESIEKPMTARLESLSEQITFLVGRIDGLEAKQAQDRLTFPKLVDGRCAELMADIASLRSQFAENVAAREEKEKRILLKVQSESNKAAVQFAQDKLISDDKIAQLRTAIDEEVAIRVRAHEMVQATLSEEVSLIRTEQAKERHERTAADDALVQSIQHYAAALQDGLRIVSTQ